MDEEKGALDQFDNDFPVQDEKADPFAVAPAPTADVDEEEELPAELKNRHIHRVERKLREEREANIALAARLSERSELERFKEESGDNPDITKIYGTDTPEAREATRLLQGALDKVGQQAEERAVKRFQDIQETQVKAQREAESFIDGALEALEEDHNIDLTSDAPQARKARREFLELVQKASPKDDNGDIKEYADFDAVFDLYASSREKATTRNKDLASRSMVKSGNTTQTVGNKVHEDYLRQIGIL